MKGLAEILNKVAETGESATITFDDSKVATKEARAITTRIDTTKALWDLEFVRDGNTITISKRK